MTTGDWLCPEYSTYCIIYHSSKEEFNRFCVVLIYLISFFLFTCITLNCCTFIGACIYFVFPKIYLNMRMYARVTRVLLQQRCPTIRYGSPPQQPQHDGKRLVNYPVNWNIMLRIQLEANSKTPLFYIRSRTTIILPLLCRPGCFTYL